MVPRRAAIHSGRNGMLSSGNQSHLVVKPCHTSFQSRPIRSISVASWRRLPSKAHLYHRTLLSPRPDTHWPFVEIADELVRLKVDIIVAPSSIYTKAARRA